MKCEFIMFSPQIKYTMLIVIMTSKYKNMNFKKINLPLKKYELFSVWSIKFFLLYSTDLMSTYPDLFKGF